MNGYSTLCSMVLVMMCGSEVFAVCPGGWIEHDSKCYFFSEVAKNWEDAGHFCQLFSAKLAEPRTNSSSTFIIGQARTREANFWLGISDIFEEPHWIYSSDMTRVTINDWDPSQPNGGRGSNCLCTWMTYNSMWVDEPCTYEYKFVCERPVGQAASNGDLTSITIERGDGQTPAKESKGCLLLERLRLSIN